MPPKDIELIPGFFTSNESEDFMRKLLAEIPWKQKEIMIFGKPVAEPRLTAWIGDAESIYTYSGITMKPSPWSKTLLNVKKRTETHTKTVFNSVLANLYRDERDSMGLHSDDEKELGKEPVIASLSFGAPRRFIMKSRRDKTAPLKTFLLESGSLLVMRGKTQKLWKHSIPKESRPCGPRINLTFRLISNPGL